jgi:hypothetical protein
MRSVVLDTNLLLLLVVGDFDRRLLARHKRTQRFSPADLDLLHRFLDRFECIVVTPNILTETSNLLRQTDSKTGSQLLRALEQWLALFEERYVASRQAARQPTFQRLGLTDAALLDEPVADAELLTDDLDLYLAAAHSGRTAHNFSHLQAADWQLV